MIEGIIGLVQAFVIATLALIELIVRLIAMVLECLGIAASSLATSPKPGEHRFSVKRLAIAFAPLACLLAMIPAAFWFASWRANMELAKRKTTEAIVDQVADELSKTIDEDGRFERPQKFDTVDAWRRKLILEYSESDLTETLSIRSFGGDGIPQSDDDIVAKRRNVLPVLDVAGAILRRIKGGAKRK